MRTKRILPGYYKVTDPATGYFGNIRREGREWHTDIRRPNGELVRFAGIWGSRKAAEDEITFILARI